MSKQQKQTKSMLKKILKMTLHGFLIVVFLTGMALVLAWYIQYRFMGDDVDKTWEFFLNNPSLYWYSFAVILGILAFLSAILRPFLATGVVSSAIIGLMFANQYKFAAQAVPLLPDDLQMAGQTEELTKFVDGEHLTRTIIVIVLILALSIFLTVLAHKHWVDKKLPWWRRHCLIQRIIIAVIAGVFVSNMINNLVEQANKAHRGEPAEWMGITTFIDYEQVSNYAQLGFFSGFVYNLRSSAINEPSGYSEDTMRQLADKYNQKAEKGNKNRANLSDKVDKIVTVLGESFYDPSVLQNVRPHNGGDVTPELHKIFAKHPHGYMYSNAYGGGTANVEFEVDTGLSNYWANTIPFVTIVPYLNDIPAIANTAKKNGFYAATIHTFNGSLYKRAISLSKEGFSGFFTDQNIYYTKINVGEPTINDYSAYHEAFDRMKNNRDKQYFNIITMQNHAPYIGRTYPSLDFTPTNQDGSVADIENIDALMLYFQSVNSADRGLGDFIAALDNFDQRTVVLFFGDHAGGEFTDIVQSENPDIASLAYHTPYFVYTNFDIGKQNLELPTTSPNCIANTMYNVLNVKKSALGYLLDEVCKDEPIITATYMANYNKQPAQTDVVKAYEMVNYDIMGGKQYWMKYAKQ